MPGMHGFRNKHFRRWLAGGLAVLWLFTVLVCAADTDALAEPPAQTAQATGQAAPAQQPADDDCCRLQAGALPASSAAAAPAPFYFAALLLPSAVSMPVATQMLVRAPVVQDAVPRRYSLLVHSLQPQAPPI